MVELKLEEVSNFLKDKFILIFFFSILIISCESSFEDFDDKLVVNQGELQSFSQKSLIRQKSIVGVNEIIDREEILKKNFRR